MVRPRTQREAAAAQQGWRVRGWPDASSSASRRENDLSCPLIGPSDVLLFANHAPPSSIWRYFLHIAVHIYLSASCYMNNQDNEVVGGMRQISTRALTLLPNKVTPPCGWVAPTRSSTHWTLMAVEWCMPWYRAREKERENYMLLTIPWFSHDPGVTPNPPPLKIIIIHTPQTGRWCALCSTLHRRKVSCHVIDWIVTSPGVAFTIVESKYTSNRELYINIFSICIDSESPRKCWHRGCPVGVGQPRVGSVHPLTLQAPSLPSQGYRRTDVENSLYWGLLNNLC